MAFIRGVYIQDGTNLDAAGRLKVTESSNFISALFQYNLNPLLIETGNSGTGVAPSYSITSRLGALSCTAGTGTSWAQTFQYYPITAGKSTQFVIDGIIGAAVANVTVDIGAFDAFGGILFRQNGTTGLEIIHRSSVTGSIVENVYSQSNWNLDKMDGTGSASALDITKLTSIVIDIQFISRARVGFIVDGLLFYAHQIDFSNTLSGATFDYQAYPLQALITSTSSGSTKTSYIKGMFVNAEVGYKDNFAFTTSSPEGTVTAANGSRTHLISLRPKTSFNGITNRTYFSIDTANILVTGNNPVYWELCVGSTFSVAPTFTDVNTTYSALEYGTGGTLSTAGLVISSGYVSSSNQVKDTLGIKREFALPISLDRSGNQRAFGTLSLIVTGIGGTSASRATFDMTEIR